MTKEKTTPQFRTYMIRMALIMGSYVAVNVAAIAGAFDTFNVAGKWAVALTCGALVAAQIWSVLVLIEQSDEFVRAFLVRQFIVGSGLSMAIMSTWGFGESYANAPHAPGWFIFVLFWGCFGVTAPIIAWLGK
jgi:putative oxidoreductase